MLRDIIPATWRKPIYAAYAVIGVVLGAIQIVINPDPEWLDKTFAVYAFLGGAVGLVASGNTPPLAPNADEVVVPAVLVEGDPTEE